MRKFKFVIVILLCVAILAACGGNDADVSPTAGGTDAGGNTGAGDTLCSDGKWL